MNENSRISPAALRGLIVALAVVGWFAVIRVVPPFIRGMAIEVGASAEGAFFAGMGALIYSVVVASGVFLIIIVNLWDGR